MKNAIPISSRFFTYLGIVISLIITVPAKAQLGVITSLTPQQLVQNVLVGGGVTVSNVTYSGTLMSYAAFTNGGATNLGLTDGIILCSGNAVNIAQPASVLMSTDLGGPSDANLDNLTSGGTHDATVLEFDFIPLSDTIKFRYVFGSEEYHDYVNSVYNDVFGFFVTGPNPLGGNYTNLNIALIPGTTLPVAINSVNNGYSGNACSSGPCNNCAYFIDNCNNTTHVFDGFTTVLTAWCKVVPCVQYHIKLAIADVGDGVLDSGVLLEQGSFGTNGINYNTSYTSNIDTVSIEGCNNAIISFVLNQPAVDSIVLNYSISGTAIEGTDYPFVPDSLIILPGQDSVSFMISPISDGIAEPPETVYIIYQNTTCGGTDTILVVIKDYPPIFALYSDYYSCSGDTVNISVGTSGGYPPITYQWSGGLGTSPNIAVSPIDSTTYILSISDACGFSQVDSVNVFVSKIAATITESDSASCWGYSDGSATVTTVDGFLPYTYVWSPIGGTDSTASNLTAGNYTVTVTDANGCSSVANTAISWPPELLLSVTNIDTIKCYYGSSGNICDAYISVNPVGGTGSYAYLWSNTETSQSLNDVCPGNYTVTVSDANGCSATDATTVADNTYLNVNASADPYSGPIPLNVNFNFTGSGGSTYLWEFGDGQTSNLEDPFHSYTNTGTYYVTLTVNSGSPDFCSDTVHITIVAELPSFLTVPNVFTPNGDDKNDLFTFSYQSIESFSCIIFNRWGMKIYEWSDVSHGWDGKTQGGKDASEGVYFYIIKSRGIDNVEYDLNGTVTLIR